MANTFFTNGLAGFLTAEIDWDTAVIKVALVRAYTPSAAHKFVSEVTGAGGVIAATSAALTAKTVVGGVADAADFTFSAVPANAANHGILVYQASAVTGGADVAATLQRTIAWFDTGTNFPIVPNNGDVQITWNASGILSI